jgi:hypothetical protein
MCLIDCMSGHFSAMRYAAVCVAIVALAVAADWAG